VIGVGYKHHTAEQVLKARDLLAAGASFKQAAAEVGISVSTMCRWWSLGPPVGAQGIAAAEPLALSVLKLRRPDLLHDPNWGDVKALLSVRLAARELLRTSDDLLRDLGGPEAP